MKASHGLIVTQFYDIGSWSVIGTVAGGGAQDNGTVMSTGGLTWRSIFGWTVATSSCIPRTRERSTPSTRTPTCTRARMAATVGCEDCRTVRRDAVDRRPHDRPEFAQYAVRGHDDLRTTDGCATSWVASSQAVGWEEVKGIAVAGGGVGLQSRVRVHRRRPGVSGDIDNGATSPWSDVSTGLPVAVITDVVVAHNDSDRVAATVGGTGTGHVFLSTNGGTAWTNITGNLPDVAVSAFTFDPVNTNTFYVGTDVGVFRTSDGGATWNAFDNGIPNVPITDLHVDRPASLLIASTFGRGMYKVSISGVAEPSVDLYLRDSLLDTGGDSPVAVEPAQSERPRRPGLLVGEPRTSRSIRYRTTRRMRCSTVWNSTSWSTRTPAGRRSIDSISSCTIAVGRTPPTCACAPSSPTRRRGLPRCLTRSPRRTST